MNILQLRLFLLAWICLASSWALTMDGGVRFISMNGHQELESLPQEIEARFLLGPGQEFLKLVRHDILDPDTQVMKIYIGALVTNSPFCSGSAEKRVFRVNAGVVDVARYEILSIDID